MTHDEAVSWVKEHLQGGGWSQERIPPLPMLMQMTPQADDWEMKLIFQALYPNAEADVEFNNRQLWILMCVHVGGLELDQRIKKFGICRRLFVTMLMSPLTHPVIMRFLSARKRDFFLRILQNILGALIRLVSGFID